MRRQFNDKELELLHNLDYSSKELEEILGLPSYTIQQSRNKLGIKAKIGRPSGIPSSLKGVKRSIEIGKKISLAKKGKANPNKTRKETRECIGKECNNMFIVVQSSSKKYCSHSCQQRTTNVAKKGIGTRKIRNILTPEYKRYARKVHGLSQKIYEQNINIINPNNYPRTRCGIDGGWQLDHIIPIKECFEKGLTPQEASQISNLRMLPWKDNLMRQYGISN